MRPVSAFQVALALLTSFSTNVVASTGRDSYDVTSPQKFDNSNYDHSVRRRPVLDLIGQRDSPPTYEYESEVIVSTGALTVRGPPKGLPERRRSRRLTGKQELARGKKSKSLMKYMKKMWPYMLVPIMMSLGYAPFMLSSLKMLVMSAMMINMMAFNAAIFLTLRNMVFGPRQGGHVKYYNFGYNHRRRRQRRSSSKLDPLW